LKTSVKRLILVFVGLLVVGVMAKPYIPFLNRTESQFSATPDPIALYEQALAEGKPVFVEFYADW